MKILELHHHYHTCTLLLFRCPVHYTINFSINCAVKACRCTNNITLIKQPEVLYWKTQTHVIRCQPPIPLHHRPKQLPGTRPKHHLPQPTFLPGIPTFGAKTQKQTTTTTTCTKQHPRTSAVSGRTCRREMRKNKGAPPTRDRRDPSDGRGPRFFGGGVRR